MSLKSGIIVVFCILHVATYGQGLDRKDFRNILNLEVNIRHDKDVSGNMFSDMGAWHAYAFRKDEKGGIGFAGPLTMGMEGRWIGKYTARPKIAIDGKWIEFSPNQITGIAFPGLMEIKYTTTEISISQRLIFVGNRQSMVVTEISNRTKRKLKVELQLEGSFFDSGRLTNTGRKIHFDCRDMTRFILRVDRDALIKTFGQQYVISYGIHSIQPGEKLSFIESHIYTPQKGEEMQLMETNEQTFRQCEPANQHRWNNYLNSYFAHSGNLSDEKKRLAVKSMITLISNWRSAAGDLHHDGVFPSISYQGFYGFWSWDSWKQAFGLSLFNLPLAKSNILSMFDYMDEAGMVADCIYFDKKENNYRDTKPPLAAWAVEAIFRASGDTAFVRAIYPQLIKYHRWWYQNRDHDGNGLCEYGSTDGTRIAAAWESGMDNAVRFDSATMVRNNARAWSLNQESVDLNTYLCAEKSYLAILAEVIGRKEDADIFRVEGEQLRTKIKQYFFDTDSGYFYDRKLGGGPLLKVAGPEGWIPLWAKCTKNKQAESVVGIMLDTSRFNTFLPLPTLDASHPDFNPAKGYWRGPVWIDQLYFGIMGMRNYGFVKEAKMLRDKFLRHAEGLTTDAPLYENYHPKTGNGLNAPNFSWTAAHILMLLAEGGR